MTTKEAGEILGLTQAEIMDPELITDAWDNQVFEFRKFVFTNAFIHTLVQKRLAKLSLAWEALNLLDPQQAGIYSGFNISEEESSTVSAFESNFSKLKVLLAKAGSFPEIEKIIKGMAHVQSVFENQLWAKVTAEFGEMEQWPEGFTKEIKIADGLNTLAINHYFNRLESGSVESEVRNGFLTEMFRLYKKRQLKS